MGHNWGDIVVIGAAGLVPVMAAYILRVLRFIRSGVEHAATVAESTNHAVNHVDPNEPKMIDQVRAIGEKVTVVGGQVTGMVDHQRRFDVQLSSMQAIGEANGLRSEQTRRAVDSLEVKVTALEQAFHAHLAEHAKSRRHG